ncbi:DUF3813 domain-containing protein [Jeotgalibacillus sp. S-D1]|uniref:DUF3813 domain-containing protein n=1 Tax=Jeotgalibacillus sp. S-D1 TaxID=2552189 RepID=UPI00105A5FC8|nr:DUF3813 domain-containing protein [Jeotgalibacillus sp. S-D1]TDL35281.1 DUF3813 domain-containing protein [Jeotgalibacillus sp. S-D1]
MKNKLFQLARSFVEKAKQTKRADDKQKAKNNLSSAFANSTYAEQKQLREMQEELRP